MQSSAKLQPQTACILQACGAWTMCRTPTLWLSSRRQQRRQNALCSNRRFALGTVLTLSAVSAPLKPSIRSRICESKWRFQDLNADFGPANRSGVASGRCWR